MVPWRAAKSKSNCRFSLQPRCLQGTVHLQTRVLGQAEYVEKLENVFKQIDDSGQGMITEERLNQILEDPKVAIYFQTLDLDVHEGTCVASPCIDSFFHALPQQTTPSAAVV